jgi:hypothetical protein
LVLLLLLGLLLDLRIGNLLDLNLSLNPSLLLGLPLDLHFCYLLDLNLSLLLGLGTQLGRPRRSAVGLTLLGSHLSADLLLSLNRCITAVADAGGICGHLGIARAVASLELIAILEPISGCGQPLGERAGRRTVTVLARLIAQPLLDLIPVLILVGRRQRRRPTVTVLARLIAQPLLDAILVTVGVEHDGPALIAAAGRCGGDGGCADDQHHRCRRHEHLTHLGPPFDVSLKHPSAA